MGLTRLLGVTKMMIKPNRPVLELCPLRAIFVAPPEVPSNHCLVLLLAQSEADNPITAGLVCSRRFQGVFENISSCLKTPWRLVLNIMVSALEIKHAGLNDKPLLPQVAVCSTAGGGPFTTPRSSPGCLIQLG